MKCNVIKSSKWPIGIYKDALLDKELSLEAKGLIGTILALSDENQNIKPFLDSLNISHLDNIFQELEGKNYHVNTTIKSIDGKEKTYFTVDGQFYTKDMKEELKNIIQKENEMHPKKS